MRIHSRLAVMCHKSYIKETFSVDDVEVLIEDNTVAVRGTELRSVKDLLRNLLGPVGYQHAAESIYNGCLERLDLSRPITVTGHSAGAAIALYLGVLLGADNIVVFGCPKVPLNDIKATSYVFENDVVSKLPVFSCSHAGTVVRLGNLKKVKWYKPSLEDHWLHNYIKGLDNEYSS